MVIRDNGCVGCETCRNCGRRYDYFYHVCDECESDEQLYYYEGKELCFECILDKLEMVDMDEY